MDLRAHAYASGYLEVLQKSAQRSRNPMYGDDAPALGGPKTSVQAPPARGAWGIPDNAPVANPAPRSQYGVDVRYPPPEGYVPGRAYGVELLPALPPSQQGSVDPTDALRWGQATQALTSNRRSF